MIIIVGKTYPVKQYSTKGNNLVKGRNNAWLHVWVQGHWFGKGLKHAWLWGQGWKTYPVAVAHVDNVQVEGSPPQHSAYRVWRRLLGWEHFLTTWRPELQTAWHGSPHHWSEGSYLSPHVCLSEPPAVSLLRAIAESPSDLVPLWTSEEQPEMSMCVSGVGDYWTTHNHSHYDKMLFLLRLQLSKSEIQVHVPLPFHNFKHRSYTFTKKIDTILLLKIWHENNNIAWALPNF